MELLNQSRDHQIPKMPMFLTKISGISSNGSLMHRMLNRDLQIPKRQWTEPLNLNRQWTEPLNLNRQWTEPQNPNRQWMDSKLREPLNLNQDRNLDPKMDLLEANLDPLMNNLAVNQHLKMDHLDPNQDQR